MAKKMNIVTPFGESIYTCAQKKDVFEGAETKFKVGIKFSAADHSAIAAKAQQYAEENGIKNPELPFKDHKDGYEYFAGTTGWKPAVMDILKRPVTSEIGNGSIIRVSGYFDSFKKKIIFRPMQIMVKELKEADFSSAFDDDITAEAVGSGGELEVAEESIDI